MEENWIDPDRISNYFKEEYSSKDETYVSDIFCDSDKEAKLKSHLCKQFEGLSSEDADKKNLDHVLHKIHYEINTNAQVNNTGKFSRILRWTLKIAGIIILPISIFWGVKGYLSTNSGNETWVEVKAPTWTRVQFSLPDGTIGWLNSNSSVKYNGNFYSDRQVKLNGEAFFDVKKEKNNPFRVITEDIEIKVLGTRFNVASYENEQTVEVVLEDGKLEFTYDNMDETRVINPNDLLVYNKSLKSISVSKVLPNKYISWKEGKLVFRNDPVDVIARRLERWYNIEVDVNDYFPTDIRLRGTFVDESLEQVMYFIEKSMPLKYKIQNGEIDSDDTIAKKKVIITMKPLP